MRSTAAGRPASLQVMVVAGTLHQIAGTAPVRRGYAPPPQGRHLRGLYGALLLAAYDPGADAFRTVTKCGTGFSDADLASLPGRLPPLARPQRPARADARQQPDVWFEPGLVLEILSAELTLSPTCTAGWGQLKLVGLYRTAQQKPAGTWAPVITSGRPPGPAPLADEIAACASCRPSRPAPDAVRVPAVGVTPPAALDPSAPRPPPVAPLQHIDTVRRAGWLPAPRLRP